MSVITCPYCEHEGIIPDENVDTAENLVEYECNECDKLFVVRTVISVDYYSHKADCLNDDADHEWVAYGVYYMRCMRMQCINCEAERAPTDEEYASFCKEKTE